MLGPFAFQCGYNGCSIPGLQAKALLVFCLAAFCVLAALLRNHLKNPLTVVVSAIIVLIAVLLPQTLFRWIKLAKISTENSTLSAHQKRTRLFGEAYLFAEQARRSLPGYHCARLETDIHLREGDGWGIHDRLAYYLYPVDIRASVGGREEVLVFFKKKNASTMIPSGYKIVFRIDDNNLAAIRTGAL